MSRALKGTAFVLGLFLLAAVWLLLPADGVPILAYHQVYEDDELYSIDPADFDEQMKYLADRGYTAVSLAELVNHMNGGAPLPAKPVVITFDDGYADNYLTALPILQKYRLKATVFVIASGVGQPNFLTWEQVAALAGQGTEIGSHTYSHVAMSEITLAERRREAAESKAVLERELGRPVEFLAYPYGKFDKAVFAVLKDAGYKGACGGRPGLNKPGDNVFALKRISIPRSKYGMWEFRARLIRANIYSKLGL